MIHVYNVYSESEIGDLDSWLPDGSSTLFFRNEIISLADFKGKIQSGSRGFNCGTNCNSPGV